MIKAEITVSTCYGIVPIPVEVMGSGPRPGTAWVRALNGLEPFCKFSHGGPTQDSTAVVLVPQLRDVHIEADLDCEEMEICVLQLDMQSVEVI
ncbi:MAG: hypothetical protein JEZ00_11330 [Anaerolineaceae bacterium]|nr:hypothetical protein [Anaerolineaceae bacterium]